MNVEGRTPTSSTEVVSQSSSDSRYCSHRPMTSTIPAAHQVPFDIIGHHRDAVITQTLQDIQELKNRQVLTDHLLKNIITSSHGKPRVTCLARQAA